MRLLELESHAALYVLPPDLDANFLLFNENLSIDIFVTVFELFSPHSKDCSFKRMFKVN